MVSIARETLERSEHYDTESPTPKQPSKLTNGEVRRYLEDCRIPRIIASPLPRTGRGIERKMGETGDLIYDGMTHLSRREKEGKAYRSGEHVEMDTYFNKVLWQAVRRGMIRLYFGEESQKQGMLHQMMLSDVFNIRFAKAIKDASLEVAEKYPNLLRGSNLETLPNIIIGTKIPA
jgi:hypothetical protein